MSPVCTTDYMKETLNFFTKELVTVWLEECKIIDSELGQKITENLSLFTANENCISSALEESFNKQLLSAHISTHYQLSNLEAHHGYTVFNFPDNGKIRDASGNPDLYYGLAKASTFGVAHTHKMSDAFNYILDGEGIFVGNPDDESMYPFYYNKNLMTAGSAFEIPIGMTHGHLVKDGSAVWFLFVQKCGFTKNLRCAGDFYTVETIREGASSPYYI